MSKHLFFSRTAFFGRFGLAKVGIGTSVVQNHCLGCDFQVSTMLHRREPSTFVFCSSTLGEKKLQSWGGVQQKNCQFFFKNCFVLKIWPSKSGYRHLRRPKSLPRMRFSSLYDASPARNINVCVFDLDLGRKKTSLGGWQQKILDTNFFFKNCFFLKIWPSKSGYRHLRRPKSLPRMPFSGLYDASPARTINFCVLLLDLGRKKTSIRGSTV